ncbi:AMP-binding protein [Sphingosinicellaceae bacterium]|nr:AMP-binding protein [Sphingosinicellaceae bacterium]
MDSFAATPRRRWLATPEIAADFRGPVARAFEPMPGPEAIGPAVPALALVAARQPDAVAVAEPGGTTSFAGLIAAASRIADAVAGHGRGHVAILLPTGASYVAAVFGCLEAHRLSVLLDAAHPVVRNAAIATAGSVDVVLTTAAIAASIDWPGVTVIAVDDLLQGPAKLIVKPPLALDVPAFILCTSGSTGLPKLIVHSQATMLHWARTTHNALHVTSADRALSLSSMASLGGFTALLSYPLAGAATEIVDIATGGIGGLLEALGRGEVTIVRAAPSLLRGVARLPDVASVLGGLRAVQSYGEPLLKSDVEALRQVLPADCLIRTTYGSTEASGLSWFARADDTHDPLRVPAGVLMPDTEAAIVDDDGVDAPRGEPGELVIRSRYNGLGEWQDGGIAAGRLVPDPATPGTRIYATGDVARCDTDGVFTILGRRDRMLNINGVRIELAEVERALNDLPGIARAEVVVRTRGTTQALLGFLIPVSGTVPDLADCKARLRATLPRAMVPSQLIVIAEMPLLPGGKVDGQALLALADAA